MADFLSKEAILQAQDIKREVVEVPEWGGSVYVYMMSGFERDEFEKEMLTLRPDGTTERNLSNFRANLCAYTIRNENGKRLFKSRKDVQQLGEKSAAAIDRVFNAAMRLNKIGQNDVEELTKN